MQVAQAPIGVGRRDGLYVPATGALLVAAGQSLAGWSAVLGFLISAGGAAVLLVAGRRKSRRDRFVLLTLVVAFTLAATPVALACPLFAPVLVVAMWPSLRRQPGFPLAKVLIIGGLVAIPCVIVVFAWWVNQPSIVFYSFLPEWVVSSMPIFVPIALCGIAAALNSTWEELLWRRVLADKMPSKRGLSRVASVIVLSILFGLAHRHSLPGGVAGVVMTGAFAVVAHILVLTLRRGILAALIAHFIADFVLLLLITFGPTYG